MKRTMLQLRSSAPQFQVASLSASITHYEQALGFSLVFEYAGFYAAVIRDGLELHLKQTATSPDTRRYIKENDHLDVYFLVNDLASLRDEFKANGAVIHRDIQTQEWGRTDFYVEDLDGHILCFAAAENS